MAQPSGPEAEGNGRRECWAPQGQAEGFPVVGIGASAGGLKAFEAFLSGLPSDRLTGMAFVLVQHLSPDHKSLLCELVQRHTSLDVLEVEEGMRLQPDCIYILPPGYDLALRLGCLHLLPPTPLRGARLPIDFFFRSLALDRSTQAVGIVLSGTGKDGTAGVAAIRERGGRVLVQLPASAEHDGMPCAAIAGGTVDAVLPPEEMAPWLCAWDHRAVYGEGGEGAPDHMGDLAKVCEVLRERTGHDFSDYKPNTLMRRIERRMTVHHCRSLGDYLRLLSIQPKEASGLFGDLLIGVTHFFRDPEAFEALEQVVLPELLGRLEEGAGFRVWVCGCASGEEAYSIAMVVQEQLERLGRNVPVQIYATDIDGTAVARARTGRFTAEALSGVSEARLARHFTLDVPTGDRVIRKQIRDLLVFSEQDVVRDPPFSRMDLISCRNLLIYVGGALQNRLMALFHFALKPGGVLFLGASETVGSWSGQLHPLDRRQKLFQKVASLGATHRPFQSGFPSPPKAPLSFGRSIPMETKSKPRLNLRDTVERSLMAHHGHAAVLVTGRGEILHIAGRTGRYLEPAAGDAGMNILAMARQGLRPALSMALRKVEASGESVLHPGLQVKTNGDFTAVDLGVRPALGPDGAPIPDLFLVVLEDARPVLPLPMIPGAGQEGDGPLAQRIHALEQELQVKEAFLQTTLDEMVFSQEELQAANEALQSVNEELQSTNEELETSKEELQSVNEELATVNAELQAKVSDLSTANNDMNNLLAGTGVATLFVDHDLCIVRFTPTATELIHLIPSDIGRPVAHLASNLQGKPRLMEDVQGVLRDLVPREAEVQTQSGAWFLMRVRPYRTLDNVIEGAVITFTDITERKRAHEALEERQRELDSIVQGMFNAFALLETSPGFGGVASGFRFVGANDSFERLYGVSREQLKGRPIREVLPAEEAAWIEAHCEAVREGRIAPEVIQVIAGHPHRCHVFRPGADPDRFCLIHQDLTERPILPIAPDGGSS